MKPSKRGPSLFEVMNKAPVTQPPRRSISIFSRRKAETSRVLPVAEALTEAEAAAELAAIQTKRDNERAAREQRQREKEAARAAKQAAKEARRAAKLAARSNDHGDPTAARSSGARLMLSLSTSSMLALAGVVTAIALGAYALGQRAARDGGKLPTVAATSNPDGPLTSGGSPLLPNPALAAPKSTPPPAADKVKLPPPAPVEAAKDNPDLAHLLQRPMTAEKSVGANQPVRVGTPEAAAARPENLNYLQIESFLVTRTRSGDQIAKDVADVREFLLKRGVRTFARKRGNGYVLFAEEGVPPGKEHRQQQEALIRKIESLGKEYVKLGGAYQFHKCFFVSFATTQAGEPVS